MAAPPSLRELLRQATAEHHARVDAQVGALDSPAAYVGYLKGMRGFLAAAAPRLAGEPMLPSLLQMIDRDLQSSGSPGGAAAAAPQGDDADEAQRLGWGYVTAGASVGARMLHRQAMELVPPQRCTFLQHYASSGLWPDWLQRLAQAEVDPEALARCVAAARQAFETAEQSFSRALEAPLR